MSKTPLISVILPSYNHARFVTSAIESVLTQQIGDFELIVVDDGSTDGTPNQVEKIKDGRIQLIRLAQNRLRHPRNLALSMARGYYVAFQNSDDEWLPNKLSKQVEILEQKKNVLACFTDVEFIDEQNQVLMSSWASRSFTTENRSNFACLHYFFTARNCFCITSALVRRDAIEAVGRFRGSLIQTADFDLWVRLAALGDFHVINEKLTLMRIVGGQTAKAPPASQHANPILSTIAKILPASIKKRRRQSTQPQAGPIVTSANLSAPKATSANRTALELASILENFAKPPISELLPDIFKDEMPKLNGSIYVQQAWLAKYAWSFNTTWHLLFADRLMASIIENEAARSEVTDVFGAEIIQEFIQRRGQLAMQIMQESG